MTSISPCLHTNSLHLHDSLLVQSLSKNYGTPEANCVANIILSTHQFIAPTRQLVQSLTKRYDTPEANCDLNITVSAYLFIAPTRHLVLSQHH